MFKKKQAVKADNDWTLEYKARWDAATKAMKRLQGQVGDTETALRCLELYGCNDLRVQAAKRVNEARNELYARAKEYRHAVARIESYYALYWEDIEVDWRPSQWKSEIEVIEFAFQRIHDLYYKV